MVFFLGFVLFVAGAAAVLVTYLVPSLREQAESRVGDRRKLWVVPLLGAFLMVFALFT